MPVDVLLGLQWGDEGKGKIVDYIAPRYDVVARFQGGPNAGHTLNIQGKRIVLHTIPSGVFHDRPCNLIGNGVVIDPIGFHKEVEEITALGIDVKGKLRISKKAHLILPAHKALDAASEAAKGKEKIGSTLKGIGPAYMDKTGRNGIRVGDLFDPDFKSIYKKLKEKHQALLSFYKYEADLNQFEKEFFEGIELIRSMQTVNGEYFINEELKKGKSVLAEGAQGSMLDIDFGTYPFVTSSNTVSAAACTGLGIPPTSIKEVIGITKAYCTRVGSGPFPTELSDAQGEDLRKAGNEFGATTGRPRRCGWLDLVALNYVNALNGTTQLIITKADVLDIFREVKVATGYEYNGKIQSEIPFNINSIAIQPVYETLPGWKIEQGTTTSGQLPEAIHRFMAFVKKATGIHASMVSIGPEREQLIAL